MKNQSKSQSKVAGLLSGAVSEGLLSQAAAGVLNVTDIGAQINDALGTPALEVTASEVVLVAQLIDDSGSIRFVQGNAQAVRDGHNLVLDALVGSKQGDGIQIHNRYLNGKILYPFSPLSGAEKMTSTNYDPNGGTPLYDQALVILATIAAKTQEFSDNGVPVRSVTLIVTDGNDEHSKASAKDVAKVAKSLLLSENHIIAGMGIDDGNTDFRRVFKEMGVPDEWILTPGNTPSEVRKAFQVFSKSAVRASQSAASFSKTAGGGFAGP